MDDQEKPEAKGIVPEGWSNPPELKDLKQDLTDAKPAHDSQVAKMQVWRDNLNITGAAKINTPKGSSAIQPKLIRKQAEWRYAALSEPFLSDDDLFDVDPVTWEDTEGARQNEILLNNQFSTKIDKVDFIDTYIRALVDEGTAIVRVGWEFEEEEETINKPIVEFRPNPELAPMHEEIHQMMTDNPTGYRFEIPEELQMAHEATMQAGVPMEPIVVGYEEITQMKTIRNTPTLEICNPVNVVIDPSCKGDLTKAGFIAYDFETSLSVLRKAGTYKNLDAINIEASTVFSSPDHEVEDRGNFNFTDNPRKKIVVTEYWGYWDVEGTGLTKPVIVAWVGDVMIRMEENPFPDKKLPFIAASLLPVKDSVYGEPDGALLEDNQKVIGAVTRGMIDVMAKSANGQMGSRKDALDATNRRKFQNGQDYEYNGNVDPRLAFHMHTFAEIPQSAQYMLQMQSLEAESMTGVKAFSNGINSNALGDVATGIRGAMDAASKRESGILRRVAKGVTDIARKIIAMNAEFLDDEEVIRVTNGDFVAVRRDDLAGEFDLKLSISTIEEDNAKAQELAFMLQTMGPSGDQAISTMILADIAKLRKMPKLEKKLRDYQPQPDPLAQELQQLEIELKKAEIAKVMADTREADSDVQLNMAKARTEGSSADQKDLDFVEQESGVKQERDKELQGEQARGNMELERVKGQMKDSSEAKSAITSYLEGK